MPFVIKNVNTKKAKQIRANEVVLLDLIDDSERKYFAARVNNRLRPLTFKIHYDAFVEFLDLKDVDAVAVYNRGLRFLFCMAMRNKYILNIF